MAAFFEADTDSVLARELRASHISRDEYDTLARGRALGAAEQVALDAAAELGDGGGGGKDALGAIGAVRAQLDVCGSCVADAFESASGKIEYLDTIIKIVGTAADDDQLLCTDAFSTSYVDWIGQVQRAARSGQAFAGCAPHCTALRRRLGGAARA